MNLAKSKTRKKNPRKDQKGKMPVTSTCKIIPVWWLSHCFPSNLPVVKFINTKAAKSDKQTPPLLPTRSISQIFTWCYTMISVILIKKKTQNNCKLKLAKENRNEVISNKYWFSCDLLNLPEGVTMGTAISCGFASNVWPKAQWLRIEPLELWARTLYW